MTAPKPDPAALIEEFLDQYEGGVHPASRKHLAQQLAAKIAALTPQASADDAAVLDHYLQMIRDDDFDLAPEGEPEASRAAVLARMDRRAVIEACARVAEHAHLVPPDGGSPTQAECDVAAEAARRIRALGDQNVAV